ncbi:MAG: hypothetical protein ACLP4V_12090 [Methylocella sp.]
MAVTKLKIVRKPPARSEEREALAAALKDLKAAERKAHQARDAQERAEALVTTGEAKLNAARVGVEKAKDFEAANLTRAAASSVKPRAGSKIRDARNAEIDAADALAAARAALTQCETALRHAEQELKAEQEFVAALAGDVITAEAASRVLREAQKLQEALVNKRVELRALLHAGLFVDPDEKKAADYLLMFRGFPATYFCTESVDWDKHALAAAWQQAREALMTNPDAPLPGEK